MKVIYSLGKNKNAFRNCVLVIGVFDGLHLGHQKLINLAFRHAVVKRIKICVMTFYPHPMQVLHPSKRLKLIMPLPYRIKLLQGMGVGSCIILPFTKKLAKLKPEDFIKKYVLPLRPKEILIGDDFRFGKSRLGDIADLKGLGEKYNFSVKSVLTAKKGKHKISSTDIRHLISRGRFNLVKKLLGRKFAVMGKVSKGLGMGRKLGFPTVNIYPEDEIVPPNGVYAVNVIIKNKRYNGMSFVGPCPRAILKHKIRIEVYIFNFKQNVYGQEIIIEFDKKMRNIEKFHSRDKLIARIKKDQIIIKKHFNIN